MEVFMQRNKPIGYCLFCLLLAAALFLTLWAVNSHTFRLKPDDPALAAEAARRVVLIDVRAEGENYPVYAAVKNYCDLSGNSFTVTDVRTKETKTFDGSAGRNAVFIYGQFGYTYTDNAVSYFSDIIPSLTESKPDVFVIEKSDKDESSIKASAEQSDPNRALNVSKLGAGNDKDVYSKIVGATVGYRKYFRR